MSTPDDIEVQQIVISEQAKAEFESQTSATATIEDVMARFFGIACEISVITTEPGPDDDPEEWSGTHILHVATVTPEKIAQIDEQEQPE